MGTPSLLRGLLRAALGVALRVALAGIAASVHAQGRPPIYDGIKVERARAVTIAEFPPGTFLENVTVDARGHLLVNSHLDGKVYRVDGKGGVTLWTTIDGTIAGIVANADGSALVSGWIKGKEPAIFGIDAAGKNSVLLKLPGGQFPNGMVRLAPNVVLVADSYRGVIWRVDEKARSAAIWVESPLLARASDANPTPAVNGLKISRGAVYASNTAKQLLVRIPFTGERAGTPEVVAEKLGLDDFDFDANGVLYGTTHVYDSVVRVEPSGRVTQIAGVDEGMAGSTALALFSATTGAVLYVVTNGGMTAPPRGGVQTAKIVRLTDVGPR